ncbi:MAG: hypothetical protein PHC84_04395, partial [Clostridia bacterium]|nr:hypothetical protein [Clostridia bacterium]
MHSKDLASQPLAGRVFYLQGEDFYWLDNANRFFVEKIDGDMRDVSIKILSKLDSLDDVIYPLTSFGFGDGDQLVIVKDGAYEASKHELQLLRDTIREDIAPYYLIFDNVKFLTAAEKKLMTEIKCSRLEKSELIPIIEGIFRPFGGIDIRAAGLMADYTQNEMSKIYLECQKLISYADGKRVTSDMVEELVTEDSELQIYHFINSVTGGMADNALRLLDRLLNRGEARTFILAALIKQYRRILHCSLSPKTDGELAQLFGVKEYAIKKAREIKNIGKVKMKGVLDMLVDYEYRFKSGQMSETVAFDAAIARLLAV